jgi:hypothetical protein
MLMAWPPSSLVEHANYPMLMARHFAESEARLLESFPAISDVYNWAVNCKRAASASTSEGNADDST